MRFCPARTRQRDSDGNVSQAEAAQRGRVARRQHAAVVAGRAEAARGRDGGAHTGVDASETWYILCLWPEALLVAGSSACYETAQSHSPCRRLFLAGRAQHNILFLHLCCCAAIPHPLPLLRGRMPAEWERWERQLASQREYCAAGAPHVWAILQYPHLLPPSGLASSVKPSSSEGGLPAGDMR